MTSITLYLHIYHWKSITFIYTPSKHLNTTKIPSTHIPYTTLNCPTKRSPNGIWLAQTLVIHLLNLIFRCIHWNLTVKGDINILCSGIRYILILSLVVELILKIHEMDLRIAFLNSVVDDGIFVTQLVPYMGG